MTVDDVLAAIPSTASADFGEFCGGLGADRPEAGDRAGWREVFTLLGDCEREGLVEVERVDGKIESLILTPEGANRVRGKLDSKRGLFSSLE